MVSPRIESDSCQKSLKLCQNVVTPSKNEYFSVIFRSSGASLVFLTKYIPVGVRRALGAKMIFPVAVNSGDCHPSGISGTSPVKEVTLLPVTYGSVVLRSEVYVSYTRFEIPDTTLNAIVQARKRETGV